MKKSWENASPKAYNFSLMYSTCHYSDQRRKHNLLQTSHTIKVSIRKHTTEKSVHIWITLGFFIRLYVVREFKLWWRASRHTPRLFDPSRTRSHLVALHSLQREPSPGLGSFQLTWVKKISFLKLPEELYWVSSPYLLNHYKPIR